MQQKTVTMVVRDTMREYGRSNVFLNQYDHCRTMKCYALEETRDRKMIKAILRNTKQAGFKDVTVRVRAPRRAAWRSLPSIIVRIPR